MLFRSVIQVPAYPIAKESGEYELIFDGVDDYISFPNQVNPSYVSISVWVKPNEVQTTLLRYILGQGDTGYSGFWVGLTTNGVRFSIGTGMDWHQLDGYSVPNIDQWNHICCTYDGTNMVIYLNGSEIVSYAHSGAINYGSITDFVMGSLATPHTSRFFKGGLSDVRIFNRSVTSSEVLALYNKESVTSGLINAWMINEESGITIVDSVGSNNGTISGASWVLFSGIRFRWGILTNSITQVYEIGRAHV